MVETPGATDPAGDGRLREFFLGWQCRVRKYAITRGEGRPTEAMRPWVYVPAAGGALGRIIVHMVKKQPQVSTTEFRHIYKRTMDPAARLDAALKLLATQYYRQPLEFSDRLTALFGGESDWVEVLTGSPGCRLRFEGGGQRFDLECEARLLPPDSAGYQATYWHNRLFNPDPPADLAVLEFQPAWASSIAEPAPD